MNDIILINIKISQRMPDSDVHIAVLATQMDDLGNEKTLQDRDFHPGSIQLTLEKHETFKQSYRNWGNSCRYGEYAFRRSRDLTLIDGVTHDPGYDISEEEINRNQCRIDLDNVITELTNWLSEAIPSNFIDSTLKSVLSHPNTSPIRLVFETKQIWLQDLPWNACLESRLISRLRGINRSPHIVTGAGIIAEKIVPSGLSKILIIQGGNQNIDTDIDISFIKKHLPAIIIPTIEIKPSVERLNQLLHDYKWDAIFYLGHTDSTDSDGLIYVNDKQQPISIDTLSEAFLNSVKNGLSLLVFNSCSGAGLARKLNEVLHNNNTKIPFVVVMQRPIGDSIAHAFIERFTKHLFVDKYSIDRAMTETRKFLRGLQNEFPGAESLPVLWCDNKAFPLTVDPSTPPPPPPPPPPLPPGDLPKSIKIIIEILNKRWTYTQSIIIKLLWESRLMKLPPITYILAAPLILYAAPIINNMIPPLSQEVESIGEKMLFKNEKPEAKSKKEEAINAFKTRDYPKAIELFKTVIRLEPGDVESRIYLSNAQALNASSDPTELPIIPVISNHDPNAKEILGGVSIAVIELNNRKNGEKPIIIKIMMDENTTDGAKRIAQKIVKQRDNGENIPLVIGHTGSVKTLAVADIYNNNKIVLIAPTSSENQITSINRPYVYRAAPNSTQLAQKLANYVNTKNQTKLGFCSTDPTVSASFKEAYIGASAALGGQIVPVNCYNSSSNFDPEKAAQEIKRRGGTSLIIYSHIETADNAIFERNMAIAARNNGLGIFASSSFLSPKISNDPIFEGIEIVTPRIATPNKIDNEFYRNFNQIFGDVKPTWRNYLSYDAFKSGVIGLEKSDNTSEGLQMRLRTLIISGGSTGDIRYSSIGDRYVTPSMAVLRCNQNKKCEFELIPENPKSKSK